MKNLFLVLVCCGLLIATNRVSAQTGITFDYAISTSDGNTGSVKGYYLEGNFRSEMSMSLPQMPNGGFSRVSIYQKDKPGMVTLLDDKMKTYSERETHEKPTTPGDDSTTVKIIGQEKMAGYMCIHSVVTEHGHVSEFWTTKDIPEYEKYVAMHKGSRYMGRGNTEAALKKAGADGFLVKTFSKDGRGIETSVELKKFEKTNLDADKFKVPEGYAKTDAPAGGGNGNRIDYSKLKDMTPEERQKFIDNMKKQNGGK
jgi:hypothetical protein